MPKPLGESLLDGARPAAALRQPSGLRMLGTLLYHKELQLKIRRPLLSLVEVLLPLLLCSTVILGVTRSEVVHKPATVTPPGFAPTNLTDAERTLGPGVWGMLLARDYAGDAPVAQGAGNEVGQAHGAPLGSHTHGSSGPCRPSLPHW